MLSFSQLDLSKTYTYADYLTWSFQERVELLKGWAIKMSPAPNLKHQQVSGRLFLIIGNHIKGKPCQVFHAPFDVRLPLSADATTADKINTVVQPDITIVCDESKLDKHGCLGAPDVVMEILSPGNTKREMRDKLNIYQAAGIPEYWLIDPEHEFVLLYTLTTAGKYQSSLPFVAGDKIESNVIKGLSIIVGEVF